MHSHKNTTSAVATCLAILAVIWSIGCGKTESRRVDNAKDVRRLDPSVWSLWARGLADEDIDALSRLKDLKHLDFSAGYGVMPAKLTDRGVDRLAALNLPKLEILILSRCDGISNAALKHVATMRSVKWLGLFKCDRISDLGLEYLIPMTNLHTLDLRGCVGITDKAVPYLLKMQHLKGIELGGCQNFTQDALKILQAGFTNCLIQKDERSYEWLIR